MTEFKKGDRVRAVRDTRTLGGRAIQEGEQFVVLSEPDDSAYMGVTPLSGHWPARNGFPFEAPASERIVSAVDFEHVNAPAVDDLWDAKDRVQREVAAEVFTVPARLDRSKDRPGDTVTVRVEEEYAHTTHPAYTISDTTAYGDPVMVGPFVLDQEHITLLDHQPAPEPEPEWKPGTLYAAASADGPVRLYRNKGIDRDYWLDAGGEMVPDEAVSKVRPLVVLDPESDTDRLWNIIREVDGNHDLGAGALAEAILERLSR
jgi:hypothetical protein